MTTSRWSEAEENAVIELYKRLLAREQDGMAPNISQSIDKTKGIDKSPQSIRMRLSNVSAVLEDQGVPRAQCLSPLSNYAKQTEKLVIASLPW